MFMTAQMFISTLGEKKQNLFQVRTSLIEKISHRNSHFQISPFQVKFFHFFSFLSKIIFLVFLLLLLLLPGKSVL